MKEEVVFALCTILWSVKNPLIWFTLSMLNGLLRLHFIVIGLQEMFIEGGGIIEPLENRAKSGIEAEKRERSAVELGGQRKAEEWAKGKNVRELATCKWDFSCFYSASSSDFSLQPHQAPPPAPPFWTWRVWTDNHALSGLYKGHFVFHAA